jgi:HK97 gp10 family phage protein
MIKLDKKDMAQLTRKINQLKVVEKNKVPEELNKAGMVAVRRMKKTAPFDTSNLRKNISSQMLSKKAVSIDSKAPYSGFVEFGGGNPKKPNTRIPFFYPEIKRVVKLLIINIENRIKKALK